MRTDRTRAGGRFQEDSGQGSGFVPAGRGFSSQNGRKTGAGFAKAAYSAQGAHPQGNVRPAHGISVAHAQGSVCGMGETDGLIRVKKRRKKSHKAAIIVLAVVVALIVGAGAGFALYVKSLDDSLSMDEQERSELLDVLAPVVSNEQQAEPFYLLLIGSDAREGDTASRSDVTMLVRVDTANALVDLVSIPRDMMVTINGSTQKINAAYAEGGASLAVQTVSEFAGVPISHYAEVDFASVEKLIDDLGGVWVNVPESFSAGNGGMDFEAGEQRLTGEQALAFARERYHVSGGDFGRAQAQRMVVQAIIQQVLAAQPTQLPGLVSQLAASVSTDLTVGDIISLAQDFQSSSAARTIYSAACPSYSMSVDGVSYVCPEFEEWRAMMQRVDAGLDPNDESAEVPEEQRANEALGAATNSPAPRDYAELAANAGLTTDDVAAAN